MEKIFTTQITGRITEIKAEEEKVYWLEDAPIDEPLTSSTYYRSIGIEDFIKKVEVENQICGITFSGNNIGFILKDKNLNK